jgi:hypothetical protein
MNHETQPGHNPPDITPFACPREDLPPEWRPVHDDLMSKGFHTAATHLRQMATYMEAGEYWNNNRGGKR